MWNEQNLKYIRWNYQRLGNLVLVISAIMSAHVGANAAEEKPPTLPSLELVQVEDVTNAKVECVPFGIAEKSWDKEKIAECRVPEWEKELLSKAEICKRWLIMSIA